MRTANWISALMIGTSAVAAAAQEAPREAPPDTVTESAIPVPPPAPRPTATEPARRSTATRALPAPVVVRQPSVVAGNLSFHADTPGRPAKTAYLGLTTSPAQPALQKQLQLKPGVGLVVDAVEPGSPAAQAGVKEYDILHKLDDQLLINAEQFGVLVRGYEPGKEVRLTVIREGRPHTLAARLAERDAQPMQLTFEGNPIVLETAPHPNQTVYGFAEVVRSDPGDGILLLTPDGKQEVRAAQVTVEDERHRLTLSRRAGRKHLRVDDKAGRPLFEGPIETDAELDRMPGELRRAYEEFLKDYVATGRRPAGRDPSRKSEPAPDPAGTPAKSGNAQDKQP